MPKKKRGVIDHPNARIYQVGGAVRDRLMGMSPDDRDWVVTGVTAQNMIDAGFKPVGKAHTVFLHPRTREEWSLARAEHSASIGNGIVHDPKATIADDLSHRDFTINAIARDQDGNLISPCNGTRDLKDRVLRHVGSSFRHDPLCIVRAARFLGRWPDFTIARETRTLIDDMVTGGELATVTPERFWPELIKVLSRPGADRFISHLREWGALSVVLPEVDALFGVPQPEQHHPEIDTGVHQLMTLRMADRLTTDPVVKFAVLVHDLGKGTTPKDEWPKHHGHEERGVELVKELVDRLHGANKYKDLGVLAARWHGHVHRAAELRPGTVLKVLEATKTFQDVSTLDALLVACECDARGRKGLEETEYLQADIFRRAADAARRVEAKPLTTYEYLSGAKIGERLRQLRIEAIKHSSVRAS